MHIVSIPTWNCGLSCSYCGYEQHQDWVIYKGSGHRFQKEEVSPERWLELFDFYKADIVEFSGGGEPLKYQNFNEIVKNIKCKWAITSNTLNSKLRILDLSKCALWTASLHLEISEKGRYNFLSNLFYLSSVGIPVSVTLVATINNIQETLRWANRLSSSGYNVHIHPYYDDPKFSWYDYPEELKFLERSKFVVYDKMLFEYKGIIGYKKCNAGKNYVVISPNGKAYDCMSDLMFNRKPNIENICDRKCMFPCDWNILEVKNAG